MVLEGVAIKCGKQEKCSLLNYEEKYLTLNLNATFTSEISTGTSTNGPITAANASPEFIPKTATATAMANSKLLLAAVNAIVVVLL
jgi:hypothetical protein